MYIKKTKIAKCKNGWEGKEAFIITMENTEEKNCKNIIKKFNN